MRFFKIFLVAFFSLVGVVGLIVGGMYLFGALTPQKVEPESIYFVYNEGQTEYYLAEDSSITINTSTKDVTVTEITLSFVGDDFEDNTPDDKGYISNGIIKVPQKVTLGQSFKVQLIKDNNLELGGEEWIVGGQSVLQASSESLKANNVQATINVDVPIKSITVKTYADASFSEEKTSFAEGETFYAKADFLPLASEYKYSKESLGTKTVYFDTYDNVNNTVELNEEATEEFTDDGKNNVAVYTSLKTSESTSITGYAFTNTKLEEDTINNNMDPLSVLENPNTVSVDAQTQEVSFVSVSVSKLAIQASNTTKYLQYNDINKIYANYGSTTSALNFGIQISGKDSQNNTQNLQSKINNIGLKVYTKNASGDYIATTASDNTFLFVDKSNNVIEPDEDGYYYSIKVNSDVNKNYWNFVPLLDNVEYAFVLNLETESTTYNIATYSAENQQVWKSTNIVASSISWKNNDAISLIVVDSTDSIKITSEEYDLNDNLNFTAGTFYTVKYIAYTEANFDLRDVIAECSEPTTKYNNYQLNLQDSIDIYELNTSILKLSPTILKSFNVRAVVLQTTFDGKLETRVVDNYSSDLIVNIEKTVQNLSVAIDVIDKNLVKNLSDDTTELTKLAFVATEAKQYIFDVVFTVECSDADSLALDTSIFMKDLQSGAITFNAQSGLDLTNSFISFTADAEGVKQSDTKWTFKVHAYIEGEIAKDAEYRIYYSYAKAEQNDMPIKTVTGVDGKYSEDVSSVVVEIYDGKIFTLEFAHDNTQENPLTETTEVESSDPTSSIATIESKPIYLATKLLREYRYTNEEGDFVLATDVKNDDGSYQIVAKDKYGNEVNSPLYYYDDPVIISGEKVIKCETVKASSYSSSLTNVIPTDNLYVYVGDDEGDVILRVNKGSVSNGDWSTSGYINYETVTNTSSNIRIERYGYQNSEIQITGQSGLLSMLYDYDGKTYELADVLVYTIQTSLSAYEKVLSYNEDTGKITVTKSIASDINLWITVTSELGVEYDIYLVIKQNISVKLTRVTSQLNLDNVNKDNKLWLYSNNLVEYKLDVTFICKDGIEGNVTLYLDKGGFSEDLKKTSNTFSPDFTTDDGVITRSIYVNFDKKEFGAQTIKISTDEDKNIDYAFNYNIEFYVEPNIMLVEDANMSKNIAFDDLNSAKEILTNDELQTTSEVTASTLVKRLIGNEAITLDDLVLSFAQDNSYDAVYLNGTTSPLNKNIFALKDNQISCTDTIGGVYSENGEYKALVNLSYGDYTFGTLQLNLGSSIEPDYSTERFVLYNGTIYYALIGGETIKLSGSGTDCINNSFVIKDSSPAVAPNTNLHIANNLAIEEGDNLYELYYVNEYITSNDNLKLTLTHKVDDKTVASIEFPVIIMPFSSDYVTYETTPFTNSLDLVDMSSLNDEQLLIKNNVYDTYTAGATISLFQTDKTYGLSQDVLNLVNETRLNLTIVYAGEDGQITNVEYRHYINESGELVLDTAINNSYMYAILTSTKNNKQLGLYRFYVKADAKVNVNYPYSSNEKANCAEYVTGNLISIELNETYGYDYPNYGKKRIELNSIDSGEEISNYSVNYSVFSVNGNENLNSGTLFTTYGLQLNKSTSILSINTTSSRVSSYTIVLKAEVIQNNLTVDTVYYTIQVNKQLATNFVLIEGNVNYEEESVVIASGESYNYSNIMLYTQTSDKKQTFSSNEELKYYYYIVDASEDTDVYINKDGKTLSLNNEEAVSDKVVNFVFYTIYCPVLTTTITFESGYNYALRNNDVLQKVDDHYEIYADLEFDFNEEFKITNASGTEINTKVKDIEIEYYLDGASEPLTAVDNKICFTQSQVGNHTLKIVAKLQKEGIANEDYVFSFDIVVKKSISSAHTKNLSALTLDNVVYSTTYKYTDATSRGWAFNSIFAIDDSTNKNVLFNIATEDVLKDYKLRIVVADECNGFVSLGDAESLEQIISGVDLSEYSLPIYLNKSPSKSNLTVSMSFYLIKDEETVIEAKLKFVVEPDIIVTLNYPQPNENSNLQYEARFLGDEQIDFNFATAETYFGELARASFKDKDGNDKYDASRVKLNVISDGAVVLTDESELINNLNYNGNIKLKWYESASYNDLSGNVQFEITVDGVVQETYVITFYNNINQIFDIDNISNLYQDGELNSSNNPEIFYATSNETEAIFSHNSAVLTFKSTNVANLTAYLKTEADLIELGTMSVGSKGKIYNWLLANTNISDESSAIKEDLSNVIIKYGDDDTEYDFTKASENSVYKNFMQSGSVSLTYRISLTYLNNEVDYQYYNSLLSVGDEGTNIQNYTLDRTAKVENQSIELKIDGELLNTYYYSVVFDFNAEFDITKSALTMSAGSAYDSGNSVLGITTLSDEEFTEEYFETKGVYYFAQLVMITTNTFEQSQTMSNVIYASNDCLEILQKEFASFTTLTSKTSIYDYCVGIAKMQVGESDNYYDFKLTAYGAQNAGNYAYILIAYSTDENVGKGIFNTETIEDNKLTYALVKIFVQPNDSNIRLLTTTGFTNSEESGSRQIISYNDSGKFAITNLSGEVVDELVLGKHGNPSTVSDLIFVNDGSGYNAIATSSATTPYQTILILKGDIADYAKLDIEGGSAILKQKGTAIAYYGDKEGFVLVQDLYGYQKKYYLTLNAYDEDYKLSLANGEDEGEVFVNYVEAPNTFFDGTKMTVVGLQTQESLGEQGAIRVKNFDKLQEQVANAGWTYNLTYQLYEEDSEEYFFEASDDESFEIPTLKDESKEVVLKIIFEITPNSGTTEIVTLSTYIKIQKRFILTTTDDDTLSVQSGVEFNLDEFFVVQDCASESNNLGDATISENGLTLLITKNKNNSSINVYAEHKNDKIKSIEFAIKVGTDFDGNEMEAVTISGTDYFVYPLALCSKLKDVDFEDYNFSVLSSSITTADYAFVADKIVSLSTSKLTGSEEVVYVKIQDASHVYVVPFNLNKNGTQSKSLVEVIANNELQINSSSGDYEDIEILSDNNKFTLDSNNKCSIENQSKTLFNFNLSTTPVSSEDLQKIKNFEVYDDNIVLSFKKGENESITDIDYTLTVYEEGDVVALGEESYKILQNIDHTRYISLYSIIGDKLDLTKTYTISIFINCEDTNSVIYYGNNLLDNETTITSFSCTKITTNTDMLSVDSIEAFSNGKIYNITKSYLVKLMTVSGDADMFEQAKIEYNVTPKYYAIDNYKNIVSATRTIYANQYTRDSDGNYIIEFNSWSNQFNLINLAGDVLASLNNGSDLRFTVEKGVGTIDDDTNALKTLSSYKPGDDFVIKVEVKVIDDDYLEIGQVQVKLNNEYVYVTNLATYKFVVSHPDTTITINSTYTFETNLVTIDDLVKNNDAFTISGNQIDIGGFKDIDECNIDVITVIQDIYSAEYYADDGEEYLKIKLKLNEIPSTYGQDVTLQIQSKTAQGTYGTSIFETLTVKEEDDDDEYLFKEGPDSVVKEQSRDSATGVLTVYLKYGFTGIIGADYSYTVKVNSTGDNKDYLFAVRTSEDNNDNDTLAFSLSFNYNNVTHTTILAVKKDSSDVLYVKNDNYIIKIKDVISTIDDVDIGNISHSYVMFLNSYDLGTLTNGEYLLISSTNSSTTQYGIGQVANYSTTNPFEIRISENVYNFVENSSSDVDITKYSSSVISKTYDSKMCYLPSTLEFALSSDFSGTKQGVYGLYTASSSTQKTFAILSSNATESINVSSYLENYDVITIVDYTDKVNSKVVVGDSIWKITSGKFIKTTITQSGNIYEFGYNPFKNNSEAITSVSNINLNGLVSELENNKYYNFVVILPNDSTQYVAIKANNGNIIYTASGNGLYTFAYQNIDNSNVSLNTSGTHYYKLYNSSDEEIGVMCVQYENSNGVLATKDNLNLLDTATRAEIIDGTTYSIDISCDTDYCFTYIAVVQGENTYYYIDYRTTSGTFNLNVSIYGMNNGDTITITSSTSGFDEFDGNSFTLYVDDSENDKTFIVNWGGKESEITIEANRVSKTFSSLTNFTKGTEGNNLTINKE